MTTVFCFPLAYGIWTTWNVDDHSEHTFVNGYRILLFEADFE